MNRERFDLIPSGRVLSIFRREKRVGPATSEFQAWCREKGFPQALQDHFATCSIYGFGTAFGPGGYLFGEERIRESEQEWPQLTNAGFLQLGYCPNGDIVVMDLSEESLPIGFVSHEKFWTSPDAGPRSQYVQVASNLYRFLQGWEDGTLPCDYYSAVK